VSFPKSKPPHNIRVLHGWLRDYARQNGIPEGRLKHAVDYAIVVSALDQAQASSGPAFAIKGGVAMELRLQLAARTTRDLDAVFLGAFDGWLDGLDDALARPIADFDLSRGVPEPIKTTSTMRVDIYLDYRGRRWGTVTLEVAPAEAPGPRHRRGRPVRPHPVRPTGRRPRSDRRTPLPNGRSRT
jgi:hypothetical protein